jgi:2-methylisocitrate lyase-like PEP mutase family enzyme
LEASDEKVRATFNGDALRSLNEAGKLILPNAWDAASARIFEEAGFPAIGTTSAGIAALWRVR